MRDVLVTGMVDDVRPYVWRSSLVLHYLESGGGIALKVLEAMAMRKPVLSNRLGCEGINVEGGRDCFLADGVDNFVIGAVQLLGDSSLRQRLADGGYRKIHEDYAWKNLAPRFDKCYSDVLQETAGQHLLHIPAEKVAPLVTQARPPDAPSED
jgi:glycosyltransferase involved in cell wall biosynthesis